MNFRKIFSYFTFLVFGIVIAGIFVASTEIIGQEEDKSNETTDFNKLMDEYFTIPDYVPDRLLDFKIIDSGSEDCEGSDSGGFKFTYIPDDSNTDIETSFESFFCRSEEEFYEDPDCYENCFETSSVYTVRNSSESIPNQENIQTTYINPYKLKQIEVVKFSSKHEMIILRFGDSNIKGLKQNLDPSSSLLFHIYKSPSGFRFTQARSNRCITDELIPIAYNDLFFNVSVDKLSERIYEESSFCSGYELYAKSYRCANYYKRTTVFYIDSNDNLETLAVKNGNFESYPKDSSIFIGNSKHKCEEVL